jgi:ribosomal protein S18 acetylase RimI-like enzyme
MTQATITLRPVAAGDEPFLREVYATTRADELAVLDWDVAARDAFLAMQFGAQARHYRVNHPNADLAVVIVDGVPAGRLYVDRRPDGIFLLDIALLPSLRNRGVGTRLVEGLLNEGATTRVPVRLHVERFNQHALAIYRRLGFRTVDDGGVYLLMEWIPATVAQRPFAGVGG